MSVESVAKALDGEKDFLTMDELRSIAPGNPNGSKIKHVEPISGSLVRFQWNPGEFARTYLSFEQVGLPDELTINGRDYVLVDKVERELEELEKKEEEKTRHLQKCARVWFEGTLTKAEFPPEFLGDVPSGATVNIEAKRIVFSSENVREITFDEWAIYLPPFEE